MANNKKNEKNVSGAPPPPAEVGPVDPVVELKVAEEVPAAEGQSVPEPDPVAQTAASAKKMSKLDVLKKMSAESREKVMVDQDG
ncbi:hypothetical protein E4U40_002512 [Claviceps sp. LM458 group G5]|nr:hypothetical protein E4U40_002512 [Claviceps sp. LM458 group G5]